MNRKELLDHLDLFIDEIRLEEKSDRTLTKYRADVLKFIKFLNHDNEITKDDLMAFKKAIMNKNYKPSTINSILIIVNKYIKWIGLKDMHLKKVRVQQITSLESIIDEPDYERLLRYARILGREDMRMIMKVLGETGIRIGELQFFTVESIQSFYIHIRNKGKDRDIIMTKYLSRELKHYCRENKIKSGPIFKLNNSTIHRWMKTIAGAARVNKAYVHAHAFRHYFARQYMKEFNNAIELSDILGHSDLKTTSKYMRTPMDTKRKQLEEMSRRKGKNGEK